MPEIELRAVTRLAALTIGRAYGGVSRDRLLPQAKIENPVTAQPIISANEFVGHAGTKAKTEHEGQESPSLRVSKQRSQRSEGISSTEDTQRGDTASTGCISSIQLIRRRPE